MKRRILSLLLALAVISTMIMAVPMTGYAATEDAYAEFTFDSFTQDSTTYVYKTPAVKTSGGDLSSSPTITGKASASAKSWSSNTTAMTWTGIDNQTHTLTKCAPPKVGSNTTFTVDTNATDNGYSSYTVLVAYAASGDNACNLGIYNSDGTDEIGKGDATAATQFSVNTVTATLDTSTYGDTFQIKRVIAKEAVLLYVGIKYNAASTNPTITLDKTSTDLMIGDYTVDLTATLANMQKGETGSNIAWSITNTDSNTGTLSISDTATTGDATSTITVSQSGCAIGDSATITAKCGDLTASCTVTVVAATGTVAITTRRGVKEVTLSQDGEVKYTYTVPTSSNSGTITGTITDVSPGTYDVSGTIGAPVSYKEASNNTTSVTVTAGEEETVTWKSADILQTKLEGTDYNAMSGKKIVWGYYDGVGYLPASIQYTFIQNGSKTADNGNDIYVAGAAYGSSDDLANVNMYVDTGYYDTDTYAKFAFLGSTNKAQINKGTKMTVPVPANSKVTVSANNTNYKIADTTASAKESTYNYTGEENGTVTIEATDSFTLYYISVEPITDTVVVTASEMTLVNNNNGTPVLYTNNIPSDATEAYVNEYQDVFGVNFAYAGLDKVGYLGDTMRGYVTTDYTVSEDGVYTIDVLASYGQSTNAIAVYSGETTVIDDTSLDQSDKLGTNGQDLYVYSTNVALTAGTYTIKYYATGQASDFVALALEKNGDLSAAGSTDSGVYSDDSTKGVIRFFQPYEGIAEKYGFTFVSGNGTATIKDGADTDLSDGTEGTTVDISDGFRGDLVDIENLDSYYYAVPYVTVGGNTIQGSAISCQVAQDVLIKMAED